MNAPLDHCSDRRSSSRIEQRDPSSRRSEISGEPAVALSRCTLYRRTTINACTLLSVIFFLQSAMPSCSATTCQTSTYQYGEGTPCKDKSFIVKRCASDKANLEAYLKAEQLEDTMQPNYCKLSWLRACANFHNGTVVVVPKAIACNDAMCDRSSFYSNCNDDTDCKEQSSVDENPPVNELWPFSSTTVLPQFAPCCSFYETNCNGALCALKDSCPIDRARGSWCQDTGCWISPALPRAAASSLLPLSLASVVVLLFSLRQS